MLISWIVWVRSLSVTRVEVAGDFFGLIFWSQKLDYTRVNTVSLPFFGCAKNNVLKNANKFFDRYATTYLLT